MGKQRMKKHTLASVVSACLGIALVFLVIRPLFVPYLLGTADGFAHMYRLVNFDAALSQGIVRPRWIAGAALGYGAPLFIFNYAVPYYIVDAIYRIGFSIQTSSQIYAAITLMASFGAMYLLVRRLWGTWAGVVSAAVYTFAPYHLITTYSYAAWGEMLAFVFPPLILLCLYTADHVPASERRQKNIWYTGTVALWVLFILTHNISSFMMSPVILFLAFILGKCTWASFVYLMRIAVLVVLLSCFFLLPAVMLTGTINIPALLAKEIALRTDYMIPLTQQMRTSYAVLFGQHIVYKEFTIGVPIIMVLCFGALMLVWNGVKKRVSPADWSLVVLLILSLMLVDPFFRALYVFRPLQYVLYPYRFLFLATFSGSVLSGYLFRKSVVAGVLLIVLAVLFGYPFTHPYIELFPFPPSFFSRPQMVGYAVPTLKTMGTAEFLPATADMDFLKQEEHQYLAHGTLPEKFILPVGAGSVSNPVIRQETLSLAVHAGKDTSLTVSTLYYPDWKATVDGASVRVGHDRQGRIVLAVPRGAHTVKLYFGYSTVEYIGGVMSIIGIVLFIASLFL